MAILTKEKVATYGIEVLVVVFGILIAFQVEEWREGRQQSRDLDAALIRLAEETAANLRNCEKVIPVLADHGQSVLTVVRVLNDGHLRDADIELNAELRNRVAELAVWIEGARSWELDSRGSLRAAIAEVAKAVDFEYHGKLPVSENGDGPATGFEDGISVNYVLEELVANRTLKNVFIEAADTHFDMRRNHRQVCGKFEEIQSSLTKMNRH